MGLFQVIYIRIICHDCEIREKVSNILIMLIKSLTFDKVFSQNVFIYLFF